MIQFLHWYIRIVDKLNEQIGRAVAWLNTALVLVICFDVFRRYLLNVSSVRMIEIEWYLFSLVFLIGAGFTLKHDRHVRVDVLYSKFSPKKKAWINLLGSLIFLIPFCIIIIIGSWPYVYSSYTLKEISPDPGGLPARFLIKGAITVGFFLLLLQAISLAFSSILIILNKPFHKRDFTNG